MWWKNSLNLLINEPSLEFIRDWSVAYEAETGDTTLRYLNNKYILILLFGFTKNYNYVDYVSANEFSMSLTYTGMYSVSYSKARMKTFYTTMVSSYKPAFGPFSESTSASGPNVSSFSGSFRGKN